MGVIGRRLFNHCCECGARIPARWIFVDDWTAEVHTEAVQLATMTFVAESSSGWRVEEHETVNGLAVLTREG